MSHELVRDGAFDLAAWRGLLARAARLTHGSAEAICPFGFELLGDRSYLRRPLARFYVLLRLAPDLEGQRCELLREFVRSLRVILGENASLFLRSVGLWRGDRVNLEVAPGCAGEPLRMINVLSRPTEHSALTDYAHYLACYPRGILDGTNGEAAAFSTSTRARRRLFQLVEMIGRGCELALGSAPVGHFPGYALYGGELESFVAGHENQPVTDLERELLRNWAMPAVRRLAVLLETPDSDADTVAAIDAIDAYSGASQRAILSGAKYERFRRVVETTYLDFAAPPSTGAASRP